MRSLAPALSRFVLDLIRLRPGFVFLAILGIGAQAHAATITVTVPFTPDQVIDFDNLTVGQILSPGDTIAPDILFGTHFTDESAIVVDLGGGDLGLQQLAGATASTAIGFTFLTPQDAAVTMIAVVSTDPNSGSADNIRARVFDAAESSISDGAPNGWASAPGGGSFFGYYNADPPGITYLRYEPQIGTEEAIFSFNDLTLLAIPEPSTALLLGLGLTTLAARRRRGSRA